MELLTATLQRRMTRRFIHLGDGLWKTCDPVWPNGYVPLGPIIHDLFDHFEGDKGTFEHEFMALGAMEARHRGDYSNNLRRFYPNAEQSSLHHDLVSVATQMVECGRQLQPAPEVDQDVFDDLMTCWNWPLFREAFCESMASECRDDIDAGALYDQLVQWVAYGFEQANIRYAKITWLKDFSHQVEQDILAANVELYRIIRVEIEDLDTDRPKVFIRREGMDSDFN